MVGRDKMGMRHAQYQHELSGLRAAPCAARTRCCQAAAIRACPRFGQGAHRGQASDCAAQFGKRYGHFAYIPGNDAMLVNVAVLET